MRHNLWPLHIIIIGYIFILLHPVCIKIKPIVLNTKNMLKQQMKAHEKLYTITVQTNKGKRLVVVPKKQYDKIKTGEKVKIKNSVLQ